MMEPMLLQKRYLRFLSLEQMSKLHLLWLIKRIAFTKKARILNFGNVPEISAFVENLVTSLDFRGFDES